MKSTDEYCCPSCGVDYIEHNGLIPTCAQLQGTKLKMEKLKNELKQLRKEKLELSNFNRQLLEIMDAQIIEIEQSYKRELEKISKP